MTSKHSASRQSERTVAADASETTNHLLEGLIVDGSRGLYAVETPDGLLTCSIRGRLRKDLEYGSRGGAGRQVKRVTVREHDPVAIGDRVRVLPTGEKNGVIEEIVARASSGLTSSATVASPRTRSSTVCPALRSSSKSRRLRWYVPSVNVRRATVSFTAAARLSSWRRIAVRMKSVRLA